MCLQPHSRPFCFLSFSMFLSCSLLSFLPCFSLFMGCCTPPQSSKDFLLVPLCQTKEQTFRVVLIVVQYNSVGWMLAKPFDSMCHDCSVRSFIRSLSPGAFSFAKPFHRPSVAHFIPRKSLIKLLACSERHRLHLDLDMDGKSY